MKIFDTHAHYSDEKYDTDREELFRKMLSSGVDKITLIGSSKLESEKEKAVSVTYNKYSDMPHFYYTVGDHPDDILNVSPESVEGVKYLDSLKSLALDGYKAIAIGEIGLDYHGDFKNERDYENQKKWFIAEINLARELKLPIVVHSRDACKDTFDIIKNHAKDLKGIIHCFSYEPEIAKEYIKLGYHIGIGGTLTFKNARKTKEVVESIDIKNIVTETDAPYLAPTPHRGERNESTYIKYVIEEIADIKNIDVNIAAETLYKNALEVYNIEKN